MISNLASLHFILLKRTQLINLHSSENLEELAFVSAKFKIWQAVQSLTHCLKSQLSGIKILYGSLGINFSRNSEYLEQLSVL